MSDAIKTSCHLRADQLELLDERRGLYRRAGERWVTGSDLMRAALEIAVHHGEEWHAALMESRATLRVDS